MDLKASREGKGPIGKTCNACQAPEGTTLKHKICSACKQVFYCSPECQRADWKAGHKEQCKVL